MREAKAIFMLGEEVVMSASRLRQRILKTPVSIEKLNLQSIQQAAAADYYDALVNLKGVQVTNSGINLTSVNTRGFATPFNSRFVQLADGMDTADPTINTNLILKFLLFLNSHSLTGSLDIPLFPEL